MFVSKLTPRRAREIFTLRAELESYAVRLAVEREAYTPAEVRLQDQALYELEEAVLRGEPFELAECDMRLHELLARGSDHQLLLETLASLRLRMRQAIVYTKLMDSDVEPEGTTHRRLLHLVRSGSPAQAASAVHEHITQAGQLLLKKLSLVENGRA